jgi:hypothetical protein
MSKDMDAEEQSCYGGEVKNWRYEPAEELPRQYSDVLVDPWYAILSSA